MDGNEVTKKEEKASKAYLYNDRVFESYDDASRACAEDGHLGSSCKEYIDEVDFVRSAQVGNEKLEGNEMTDSEKYRRAWLVRFRGGAECLDLTKDYGRIAAPTEKIPGYFLTDSDLTALKEQHEAELREAFEAGAEGRLIVHDYEERETTWLAHNMTGVRYVMRYKTFEDYQNQKKEGNK